MFLQTFRPRRSLRFTKFGTYVVLITVAIGLGAMNTGNNLVYMIFGMMLGFITASGILSEISLQNLEADWMIPSEIFAGKTAIIRLILKNRKKKLPSFGIRMEGTLLEESKRQSKPISAFFHHIPPQTHGIFDCEFTADQRGGFSFGEIKIETRFPFGFFRKYSTQTFDKNLIVYPKINPSFKIEQNPLEGDRNKDPLLKGWSDSFREIRDFREGDSARSISWKTSAKQSRLMVRETERETENKLTVSMGPQEQWKKLNESELESAVSFAASFVWKKFAEGFAVGLLSQDYFLEPSLSKKSRSKILSYLSIFNPLKTHHMDRSAASIPNANRRKMWGETREILSLWKKG